MSRKLTARTTDGVVPRKESARDATRLGTSLEGRHRGRSQQYSAMMLQQADANSR